MMTDKNESILIRMTELSDEVCFIYDSNEKMFVHVNEAFTVVTHMDREILFKDPKSLLKILHKEDAGYIKEKFLNLLKKKESSLLYFRIIRGDDQVRWIRLKIYPIIENGQILYITGTGEDDTARRMSLLSMEKINAWKNASLEILSHDLRGPIGAIKMLASIINKKLPTNPDIHKLTSMIEDIAKRNIELIQGLLSRETLNTHDVQIRKERLDVVWEVNQALEMYMRAQINIKKKISFTHAQDKLYVALDSLKFLQIINNLVSNAMKFTGDNGQIKIHIEKLETTFLLTVEDDGIGIPKSMQAFLFRKYTEAGREGVDGEKSVGLGMWIVKSIIEEHQGKVWFETEVNSGTTFYVEIPLGL
jgi:two-component system sensor histidine kinase VicK